MQTGKLTDKLTSHSVTRVVMSPFWASAIVSRCNPPAGLRLQSFFIPVFTRCFGFLPLSSAPIVGFSAQIASCCLRNTVICLLLFLQGILGISVLGNGPDGLTDCYPDFCQVRSLKRKKEAICVSVSFEIGLLYSCVVVYLWEPFSLCCLFPPIFRSFVV